MFKYPDLFYDDGHDYRSRYFYHKLFLGEERRLFDELSHAVNRHLKDHTYKEYRMDVIIKRFQTSKFSQSYQIEGMSPRRVLTFTYSDYTYTYDEEAMTLTIQASSEIADLLGVPVENLSHTHHFSRPMFFSAKELAWNGEKVHKEFVEPCHQLTNYLQTPKVQEDEQFYTEITDWIYHWCRKNIPEEPQLIGTPGFSICVSFFRSDGFYLSSPGNHEDKCFVDSYFRSNWKRDVPKFLHKFVVKASHYYDSQKMETEKVFRISADAAEGTDDYIRDASLWRIDLMGLYPERYKEYLLDEVKGQHTHPIERFSNVWRISRFVFSGRIHDFKEMVDKAKQLLGDTKVHVSEVPENEQESRVLTMDFRNFTACYDARVPSLAITANEKTREILRMEEPNLSILDTEKTHRLALSNLTRLDRSLSSMIRKERSAQKMSKQKVYRLYVDTLRKIAEDLAPYIASCDENHNDREGYVLYIDIPQDKVITVILSPCSTHISRDAHNTLQLNLDDPDHMNAWRTFFSIWRIGTMKKDKVEYQNACDAHDKIHKLLHHPDQ